MQNIIDRADFVANLRVLKIKSTKKYQTDSYHFSFDFEV